MKVARMRTLRRGSGLISMKRGSVRAAISRASFTRSLMALLATRCGWASMGRRLGGSTARTAPELVSQGTRADRTRSLRYPALVERMVAPSLVNRVGLCQSQDLCPERILFLCASAAQTCLDKEADELTQTVKHFQIQAVKRFQIEGIELLR